MKGKNLLRRLDFIIVGILLIFAAAMSGISLRFTLSSIDTANQTNTLIPYVPKNAQQSLQINYVGFKSSQPPPTTVLLECPKKPAPPTTTEPPLEEPAPTDCPSQQCGFCSKEGTCTDYLTPVCPGTSCKDCSQRTCEPYTPLPPPQPPETKPPAPVVK
ncbi:MAG: hypothetical protein A2W22_04905 [Candidatus Levybacteria bacterium RBG_16_35_11]|nr:MAG: hypothetical protein A2W22_04905 [Candidatus Levybacteria bacterium RBG_16_35_11]